MTEVSFSAENLRRFQTLISKYEQKRSALLPTLWLAQEQFGFLKTEVMDYVAQLLEMPKTQVYEAVTFYVMFKKSDLGKYCIQVCCNISCTMMGANGVMRAIQDELGISVNQVTEDKMFSLVPVQCLGSCDTAPVLQVNDSNFEKLTPELAREIIKKLRSGQFPEEYSGSKGIAQ